MLQQRQVVDRIEDQVRTRLNDAQRDLYRRLGEAVERVGERLREDENGKPLVFRDSENGGAIIPH